MRSETYKLNEKEKYGSRFMLILFLASVSFMLSNCTKKNLVNEQESKEPVADSVYVRVGNDIVAHTFDTLRNSLLQAIKSQRIEGAIAFCNEQAYPITDLFADSVIVRRTALLFRNPANAPDILERFVLNSMSEQMKVTKMPDVRLIRSDSTEEIHFFKPILLQPLCLNCHGMPGKQIKRATLVKIQQLYPNDHAINFKEGDLRGVWHLIFNSQKGK